MNDIDIYNLASNVLGDITHGLNEGIYAELGGELTITWCTERKFGAYASSLEEPDKPPKHRVTMYYELARQVWRDAEQLCKFLRSIPQDSDVDKLYDFYGDRTKLPECFNEKDLVNNIFVAAITWVYFHEIGHLMQEHGIIRDEFREGHSGTHKTANVYDFEASNHNRLVGREALVSHVTELAADFEATNLYILELLRHVNDPYFVGSKERKEVLSSLIYLMICGLSLLFLRFNGSQPILPTVVIEGSHPNPLIRLELNVPQVFEMLDMAEEIFDHGLDRKQLILLCGKAALSATLFWSMSRTEKREFDDRFLLKGLLSNSVVLQYLQPIVACWDEILPRVQEVRRFGPALGLMSFSESFKERVASITTWGNGPERKSATSPSPDVRS